MGKLHLTILTDHTNICSYIWEVQNFCKQLYIYIYILEVGKNYTFIPTSLFRDLSLFRGF